ncbi:MAG TPA: HEAT repeat domain-containing protein [Anaerolineales bacterium]|nr:HEAT repeat domain-containing protein [Anaerolineales bacterium]
MKLCVIISLLLSVLSPPAHTVCDTELMPVTQEVEMKDAAGFLLRLRQERLRNLFEGATWTLTHNYSDFRHMQEVMNYVQSFFEALDAYEKGNPAALSKLGGLRSFKDQLAKWLVDNDQSIRAYAAVMLGICGDRAYSRQLGNLLENKKYGEKDLLHYDRGRAAVALGLVGATEYTSRLVGLLRSKNEYDRAGAAYGLGFLTAKAYAVAIAKLLDDEDESVREAAKESLEMIGAKDLLKKGTRNGR